MTLQETRAYFEKMMSPYKASPDISLTPVQLKHCKGVWMKPPQMHTKKVMLFFHGGGYTRGSTSAISGAAAVGVVQPDTRGGILGLQGLTASIRLEF